jgi:hypothetical protein
MARSSSILLALLLLQGCAYHRLVVKNPNPADQTYHPVSSTALGWGAIEEQKVADKCETSLLSEIRVRTSLAQALVTVLTLGLVQPARVDYRCSKAPTGVGTIEP